ncbi:LacI family DNA-binding transcriptional regulator [Psychrosphaera sp. B3R10]|uniref:LacI family DNA-binding transcriptional regulator n=1 Tax=Psychrosphaera algicola TaxID=3023714 RepID=A0ABT5FIE9_9GAMM|nr:MULTISPECIES: LacI family DNA-binding transcriptional regulator [unclassified Psychrosphaera]MBU2881682.1 LacI family DNA-binding transcriptional regulator [Psychrosphaera sp. I2R16]MBU2991063.1 LacI family DNA-binding transcriptional regulator [Psychrosphaera sp. B3R10]MDC2890964.1 LacI family DNA-binding transcriptional regulator [Psychrosphaera sp. G1-22]MDO6718774.1 LacI family DNA-binding transcriptional regulator [Psychrosphaera sp. 1_MG-2023]
MESKTNVTINDVARIAGVSKRTVSRVINGSPMVGKATRERVEEIIKEVKFQPDKQARGLASNRSYLLGLIYDNPDALYIDQVQRGALDICSSLGFELVVHPCQWQSEDFIDDCLNFIGRSRVDGVIIIPPVSESDLLAQTFKSIKLPYIRIASTDLEDSDNIVITDDRAAMTDIADHLVDLGHSNIAMITGPMTFCSSQERFEGFRNALQKRNIELPQSHILEGENSYESGIECATALLKQDPRPTAIFANNDEMAAGAVRASTDLGLKIPNDLSIAGFDDNIIASRIIPSLTTIRRPVEKIASLATKKLIQSISPDQSVEKEKIVVKPYLITRESTKQCPT